MYTMGTLLRHGSAAQKQRYLPAIARGELRLQAFGVTEPTSGTDTLSLRTTATRDGEHYVVSAGSGRRGPSIPIDAALGADHAEGSGEIAHRRTLRLPRRHARGERQWV